MMGPNNILNVVQPRTFVNQNNNFYKHQQHQLAMEKPFITEMRKIINSQDPNKTDILGELIFYFLKSFISKYNLNSTE
jgi:hypothetical protein